jgi:hypothetical protein
LDRQAASWEEPLYKPGPARALRVRVLFIFAHFSDRHDEDYPPIFLTLDLKFFENSLTGLILLPEYPKFNDKASSLLNLPIPSRRFLLYIKDTLSRVPASRTLSSAMTPSQATEKISDTQNSANATSKSDRQTNRGIYESSPS